MSLIPFIFDRSSTAKLIRAIDSPSREPGQLEQLQKILARDINKLPYGYLDQAYRRSALMLPIETNEREKDILQDIYMTALRRIQRIHIEDRP